MSITAGSVVDKVSEIRSKIAVFEGLLLYLRSNYLSSDAGDAEMRFARADYATVPEAHVEGAMHELETRLKDFRDELHQWENLSVNVDDQPAQKNKKKKETANATDRGNQDQPTSSAARRPTDG